jgi:hypothetical protein
MEFVEHKPSDFPVRVPNFRDADRAWKFLKKYGFYRLPSKPERSFLKNLDLAIDYARRVGTRLPEEFEVNIKKNPQLSFDYMNKVISSNDEFAEVISSNPVLLVRYSKEILKGRLPEHLEDRLMGDPHSCFEYSWQILDGRLPERLHNYMLASSVGDCDKKYRGYKTKLLENEEFSPDYSGTNSYFEFIKWQRKNLHRLINHYGNMYGFDSNVSLGEFLYELEHGR